MDHAYAPPLETQLACAEREVKMRQTLYTRWVRERRMSPEVAAFEIDAMAAICDTLRSLMPPPAQTSLTLSETK